MIAPGHLRAFLKTVHAYVHRRTLSLADAVDLAVTAMDIWAIEGGIQTAPVPTTVATSSDKKEIIMMLVVVRNSLRQLHDHAENAFEVLRKVHGALDRFTSLDQMMSKLSATVDRVAFAKLCEQVASVHTHHLVNSNTSYNDWLDQIVKDLTAVVEELGVTEDDEEDFELGV